MEHIPILRMGEFLLITVQVDMHDRLAMQLQDDLTEQIVRYGARGVPARRVTILRVKRRGEALRKTGRQ